MFSFSNGWQPCRHQQLKIHIKKNFGKRFGLKNKVLIIIIIVAFWLLLALMIRFGQCPKDTPKTTSRVTFSLCPNAIKLWKFERWSLQFSGSSLNNLFFPRAGAAQRRLYYVRPFFSSFWKCPFNDHWVCPFSLALLWKWCKSQLITVRF